MSINIIRPNAKTVETGNKETQKFLRCGFGVLVILVFSVSWCVYFYNRCKTLESQMTETMNKNTDFIQSLILNQKN